MHACMYVCFEIALFCAHLRFWSRRRHRRRPSSSSSSSWVRSVPVPTLPAPRGPSRDPGPSENGGGCSSCRDGPKRRSPGSNFKRTVVDVVVGRSLNRGESFEARGSRLLDRGPPDSPVRPPPTPPKMASRRPKRPRRRPKRLPRGVSRRP